MSDFRRRALSPVADEQAQNESSTPMGKGMTEFARDLRGLVQKFSGAEPNPANPVVNGASASDKPWLRGLLADLATQLPRGTTDISLVSSLAHTQILDGGMIDDKTYQMEQIIQLAASLPTDSKAQSDLASQLIKVLWNNLQHPPLSLLGHEFRYRTADGSNNNLMYPDMGKAGSRYARTVTPKTLQPGVRPDPGVIFDSLFARFDEPREHPNKISSMLFYLAAIIIHDVFYTDPMDPSKVMSSSYLDLAPLYGNNDEDLAKVRTFKDGFLKPDTFSTNRLLGFPPGVGALLVCFNRYHNYVATELAAINENGRYTRPTDPNDKKGFVKLDENLFQTARLVTCGLYVNIILTDYVRTILNLNRADSTWTLDPRENSSFFDSIGAPQGIGNQVSVEFNLVYRWHSATSKRDEAWTNEVYKFLFPNQDISKLSIEDFTKRLRGWVTEQGPDPSKWSLDFGRYTRNKRGCFEDTDLVELLTASTEDVACAFGPRQVPIAMKLVEIMGIEQARAWNVATLNEFRKYFSLEPHKTFSDISSDPDVQHALRALYDHPDYVELYPGLVAEDAKQSLNPGSGICLGFTTSRTILSDAVALVRGDRFYTIDYSPASMTNWGFNSIKSDPSVAQGHVMYNLFMRALPGYYRGNSVYAMFPLVIPEENRNILIDLGIEQDYSFDKPALVAWPQPIKSWQGVVSILADHERFKVPWGPHITALTGREYMLGNDKPRSATDHVSMFNALYCPRNGLDEIRRFYEVLTKQLIVIGQERLRADWFQLDVCSDVAQLSHAVFVGKMWHIPLKAKGDLEIGVEVDQMYLAMSLMFAYVFLDGDTARSFRLKKAAKKATDKLTKLLKVVCEAVRAGDRLHVSRFFYMGEEGQMLEDYGRKLILRMFDNGWDLDTVVANLIPTAAAAVATQSQHMTQMIDLYLQEKYQHHWPAIQKLAQSDKAEDFETLKSYALEANRLAPASYGLLRTAAEDTTVSDHGVQVKLKKDESIYTDFLTAGVDPKVFPDPYEIKLDRPRESYIHHGWGMHACVGRQIVEVSMAAQLKVFAQLKNLRRAPGPQGHMKFIYPQPNPVSSNPVKAPGHIKVFMKEDWGDLWPFPTTLKVHHDGFFPSYEPQLARDLNRDAGFPDAKAQILQSSRENSRSRSPSPSPGHKHHEHDHAHQNGTDIRQNGIEHVSHTRELSEKLTKAISTEEKDISEKVTKAVATEEEKALAYGEERAKIDMSGVISESTPSITLNGHLAPDGAK